MDRGANIEQNTLGNVGIFAASRPAALPDRGVSDAALSLRATNLKNRFKNNGWPNSWDAGIFEYHHYYSITHPAAGIYAGSILQLNIQVKKKDRPVSPARVAHNNLADEKHAGVGGAYPDGCYQTDVSLNDQDQGIIRCAKSGWKMDHIDQALVDAIGNEIFLYYE